jgi:hypothetical protein
MSISKLLDSINTKIDTSTDRKSHYTHLRTALNNLVKYDLISDYTLKDDLTTDLSAVREKYRVIVKRNGQADQRGPISKVNKLSEYYIETHDINYDKLSVAEILLKSAKLKFGEDIYLGTIPKIKRFEIKKTKKTLSSICSLIVREGYEITPSAWNITDINNRIERNNSVHVIKKWFTGERYPSSTKIPVSRLHCLEKVLNIPKNVLVNKSIQLDQQASIDKHGSLENSGYKSAKGRQNYAVQVLNKEFYEFFLQYSEYKIHGIAPKAKYTLEERKFSFGGSSVRELNSSGKESRWTAGNNGKNANLVRFNVLLRAFCSYCVTQENIAANDVSLSHMTDSFLLERLQLWEIKTTGIGLVLYDSLLHLIKVNCGTRGFLRLCGNKGDRSIEDYFAELNHLTEEIPFWMAQIKDLKANVSRVVVGGKSNVKYFLTLEVEKRLQLAEDMKKNLIERADSNYAESLFFLKKSQSNKTQDSMRERTFRKSGKFLNKAYQQAMTANIFNISFTVCPRVGNWASLNYFDSQKDNIHAIPALTQDFKGRYEVHIPLSGPNQLNLNEDVRYIKNAKFASTRAIIKILKPEFSPEIKNFLKIRKFYINNYMQEYVDLYLKKLKKQLAIVIKTKGECILNATILKCFRDILNEKLIFINSECIVDEKLGAMESADILKKFKSKKAEYLVFFKEAIKLTSTKLPDIKIKNLKKKQLDRAINRVETSIIEKSFFELAPDLLEVTKSKVTPKIIEMASHVIEQEIRAYSKFDKTQVTILFPWVGEPKNYSKMSADQIMSNSQREHSIVASLERRAFFMNKSYMATTFKAETRNSLKILVPGIDTNGFNIHANRHICAITHLDQFPGDWATVAVMINDTQRQVIETYGDEDRDITLARLANMD